MKPEKSEERHPEAALTIRPMMEDDVAALCRCVRACYGDSYPARDFYDPDKLRTFLSQGLLRSQIALTREGEVVGHLGVMLDAIDDTTADAVAGFVAPDYRGSDTMFRLGAHMSILQQDLHLVGLQLYALMLHNITYRKTLAIGGVEAGLLPAHFPASTSPRGFERDDARSRISAMFMYVPLQPAPARTVYVPERYVDIIDKLYGRLRYSRSVKKTPGARTKKPTSVIIHKNPGMGIVQIKVQQAGYDLPESIAGQLKKARKEGLEVVYLDIPLSYPVSTSSIDGLRSLGFFYGGVVVERGGGDSLRLQGLINATIAPDEKLISSQSGRDLLSFVLADAHEVGAI